MTEWIRAALDVILILLVGTGVVQAMRLIRHLTTLKQSRVDMERFVRDFNSTVMRAEAGIKGLREAARDTGDDLEKLVNKAGLVRDELHFLVESADQIAERLSQKASGAARPNVTTQEQSPPHSAPKPSVTPLAAKPSANPLPSSRAEKELIQALQKLN